MKLVKNKLSLLSIIAITCIIKILLQEIYNATGYFSLKIINIILEVAFFCILFFIIIFTKKNYDKSAKDIKTFYNISIIKIINYGLILLGIAIIIALLILIHMIKQ